MSLLLALEVVFVFWLKAVFAKDAQDKAWRLGGLGAALWTLPVLVALTGGEQGSWVPAALLTLPAAGLCWWAWRESFSARAVVWAAAASVPLLGLYLVV